MRTARYAEAAEPRQLFFHAHRGGFAQPQAAILRGHAHAEQPQFPCLAENFLSEPVLLVLQRIEVRQHLLFHELLCGLRHQALFRRQIFGRKHEAGVGLGE